MISHWRVSISARVDLIRRSSSNARGVPVDQPGPARPSMLAFLVVTTSLLHRSRKRKRAPTHWPLPGTAKWGPDDRARRLHLHLCERV